MTAFKEQTIFESQERREAADFLKKALFFVVVVILSREATSLLYCILFCQCFAVFLPRDLSGLQYISDGSGKLLIVVFECWNIFKSVNRVGCSLRI